MKIQARILHRSATKLYQLKIVFVSFNMYRFHNCITVVVELNMLVIILFYYLKISINVVIVLKIFSVFFRLRIYAHQTLNAKSYQHFYFAKCNKSTERT